MCLRDCVRVERECVRVCGCVRERENVCVYGVARVWLCVRACEYVCARVFAYTRVLSIQHLGGDIVRRPEYGKHVVALEELAKPEVDELIHNTCQKGVGCRV